MSTDQLIAEIEGLEAEREELERKIEALDLEHRLARVEAKHQHAAEMRTLLSRRRVLRRLVEIMILIALGVGIVWFLMRDRITPLELRGTVTTASEHAPVAVGSACTLGLKALIGIDNAHLTLSCASTRLYGSDTSFGALRCDPPSGAQFRCEDSDSIASDGDPSLRLERAAGTIDVADGHRWSLQIALEPE